MRRLICLAALCLILSGCGWMDGSHVTVTDHEEKSPGVLTSALSAADYQELTAVLEKMVEGGTENGVIQVPDYDQEKLQSGIAKAVDYVRDQYSLGAYAVESVEYDIGSGGGQPAISVNISYIHGRSELRQIQTVQNMEEAGVKIREALKACNEGIVLRVQNYQQIDLKQMVADFATEYPEAVMEMPQVAVGVYPDWGTDRVVEMKFTYQTSRDVLRQMRSQVQLVFMSASYYIDKDSDALQKYIQLRDFIMERHSYITETSITPAYSLLIYGVGDSRAMATTYAAMCRQAGLECKLVTGTREGEFWCWNMIQVDGKYYHVDLLHNEGGFQYLPGEEMNGYVWDYSGYPEK